jgi:type II secretory pathway pseudopilin PulG
MSPYSLHQPATARRGITLMEVLVSIGIIAIGLTSVMSLIPAGKSEAGKALVFDRAATMAMNTLADAVTYGLTRPDSFVATNTSAATVVFDPANVVSWPAAATVATLKADGILTSSTTTATASLSVERLFSQGRDDVAYNPPATADGLPTNGFINGIRGFEGRMSSLVAVTQASGTPPLTAGDYAMLSVVTFHNRDTNTPMLAGSLSSAGLVTLSSALPTGRTLKSILRPGTVLYYVDSSTPTSRLRFAQLSMAAVDTTAGNAYVTFSGQDISSLAPPLAISILVDSVGLAERIVTLEGQSPYGQ